MARRGRLKVRTGKGDAYREVPLNSASRKALDDWFEARADQLAVLAEAEAGETPALWLSRSGRGMTSRAVDMVGRYRHGGECACWSGRARARSC